MVHYLLCVILLSTFFSCTKKVTVNSQISGTVSISQELEKNLQSTDVLYVIVRGQQIGPPTAVKRFSMPKFPLRYVVSPEDIMIPGTPGFAKGDRLTVSARISRTGNASPSKGDLEGVFAKNPAKPGESNINLTIDRVRN